MKMIIFNELRNNNEKIDWEVMKALITETQRLINRKGIDASYEYTFENFMIVSNNKYCVYIEEGDRRYDIY